MKIRKQNTAIGLFMVLVLIYYPLKAQNVIKSYSLKDCVSYARDKNNDIKSARIDEEIAQKKVNEVIGSGLPQFSISGNLTNNLQLPVQLMPGDFFGGTPGSFIESKFGTKYNFTFTGQFSQLLFNGSFWVGLSAAKQSANYYGQNTENVSEKTAYDIASVYYQTLVVQKQICLLEYNMASLEKVMEDTKLRFENGKAKEIDIDRLNVSHNNLKYQLKKAREGLKQSYNVLKFRIGMPIERQISLADSTYFSQDSLLAGKIGNIKYTDDSPLSYSDRIEYRILQTTLELRELNKINEISKYLPTISAVGSYSYQALRQQASLFDSDKKWYKFYSVGLQISVPVSTGGQNYSRIQQASLEIDKLKENIKKAEQGIELEMSNALIKYDNAYDNTQSENLNVSLASKVYNTTQVEYKEGAANASALIDSETKLREAQTNYINSLLDLYIARLDVEKAKGYLMAYINSL